MTLYERLGVVPAVNGVGPATRLGGLPLHPEVVAAMRDAVAVPVRMDELQERAGAHLADLIGVEGVYITAGAASALMLATAVAIAGDDAARADRLPRTDGLPNEVVIQAAHADPYDRAIESAGGRVVTVGYPDSTHLGEIERAIGERTAAVAFRPGRPGNHVPLEQLAALAHERGLPVIVDGAVHAPPFARLRSWFEAGADLVSLSGGKALRGPQATGLLCGRGDLIDRVAVHHQDMDERESTWRRNTRAATTATPPRHGIARAAKVGREQLAGLVVAVERYISEPGGDDRDGIAELREFFDLASGRPFGIEWIDESPLGVPEAHVDVAGAGVSIDSLVRALAASPTPVHLGESEAWRGILTVNPMALNPGDGRRLAHALTLSDDHPLRRTIA